VSRRSTPCEDLPVTVPIPRRRLLQGSAALGLARIAAGCSQSDTRPPRRRPRSELPRGWDYPTAPGSRPPFCHGVASGDPLGDRVVIWTRLTLPDPPRSPVRVRWRVGRDRRLRDVVARGTVTADAARDWTVKVDVGDLEPGTTYYYDFTARDPHDSRSPVGRTKTAPALADGIGIAVVACSSYWSGWWNAYDRIAERDDVDLVVHCGDHIYDTVDSAEWVRARNDRFEPDYVDFRSWRELDEVRRRYALHYAEPSLLALHRAHPLTIAWDNHDVGGDTEDQPELARQAFWEWTPCRPPDPVVADDGNLVPADVMRDHRHLRYGDVDLFVLDLRTRSDDTTILGAEQRAWFESGLLDSVQRGAPWRIVVNPIPIARVSLGGTGYGGWTDRPGDQESMLRYLVDNGIDDCVFLAGDAHGAFVADLPPDQSPAGYDPATGAGSAAVEILANSVSRGGADETVADGLYRDRYGTEPNGDRERFTTLLPEAQATTEGIESSLLDANPSLAYAQWRDHGYGMVRLGATDATLEQWFVPHLEPSGDETLGARFTVARGTNHVAPAR
jgi:alkaline phosphatase D